MKCCRHVEAFMFVLLGGAGLGRNTLMHQNMDNLRNFHCLKIDEFSSIKSPLPLQPCRETKQSKTAKVK